MSLNRLCLVLNNTYEPCNICSARRALKLLFKGAAVVEAPSRHFIRTPKINVQLPSVIRLVHYRKVPRSTRSVSRKGVILRDGGACQYCGQKLPSGSLTLDHVVPRSRGGESSWLNLVSCCFRCNNRKGDRTPEEAGMALLKKPSRLSIHGKHRLMAADEDHIWDQYLFC